MLEPTQVAPYSHMTSSSSPPSQTSFHQRLPSITHVTSALQQQQPLKPLPAHNVHQELQPLSAHNMHQHAQIMPQHLASLPPPRHAPAPPTRIDSLSSVDSSTTASLEYNSQPLAPSSSHRPRKNSTTRRDSSASSSHTNQHQRRRPGGQTKAACLPCRKRKSKVPLLLLLQISYTKRVSRLPSFSRNSAMAAALPANAAPQKLQFATIASRLLA